MTDNKLDVLVLREQLVAPNGPYAALDVLDTTGSTNADLMSAARGGAADRTVLVAERQTAGRGRRSRTWVSPEGSGVYLSVLVRPTTVPAARLGTLGMVAGLALMHAARETAGIDAVLKWPNDLLVGADRTKAAGVLSEVAANHTEITASFLRAFAEFEAAWRLSDGDVARSGVLAGYREACGTIGQRVRAELPDGTALTGVAVDVDEDGRLLLDLDDGTSQGVSAGDVVHLRKD